MKKVSLFLLFIFFLFFNLKSQIRAFPGAEGYGAGAIGGRGGKIIEVTNLNDAGNGSFRAALVASGPRIVVFRVAGIIELNTDITISNPYITIAGQTAPGDGICIKYSASGSANRGITIATHDVVIRYLRIRAGFSQAIMDYGSPFFISGGNSYNVILDHCSSGWHPGRTGLAIYPLAGQTVNNITVQRHLAAEALMGGNYPNGARGAFVFSTEPNSTSDGVIDHITMYKNLMAHHNKRHPEAKTCQIDASRYVATYQFINNVAYNFRWAGMGLWGNENDATTYHFTDEVTCNYNAIGNYFKRSQQDLKIQSELNITPGVRVFAGDNTYGNIGPSRTLSSQDPWSIVSLINYGPSVALKNAPSSPYQVFSPFDPQNLPVYKTANDAYTDVLNDVGANKALNADGTWRNVSDPVDIRILNDVINNSGDFINSPADVGGWPTYGYGSGVYTDTDHDGMPDQYETVKGFNPNSASDGSLVAANGYTNVEIFLNGSNPSTDTQAPGVPTGLSSGLLTSDSFTLSWAASTDNVAVTGYDVYKDGVWCGSTTTATSLNLKGLTSSTAYSMTVKAKDAAGNVSAASTALNVTTATALITNLALNKTATASTFQSENAPEKGNDDNTATRWAATSGAKNEWWKVDLGSAFSISGTEVTWEEPNAYKYKIEVSADDTNWTLKVDNTANVTSTKVMSDNFQTTARYVRITITDANGWWASFWEFKVFGSTSITTGLNTVTDLDEMKIYPNPSDGNFNVSFNIDEKMTGSLEVRNVLGQLVYQEKLTDFIGFYSKPISIAAFGKGMYMVTILKANKAIMKKVIVH